ncbi:hypothetical protein F0P96_06140 [Hymenobacter busanensis]|uniref:T9SS C-terminal target domain-containing protein n=1 Tax=Hymenobacter busanensis TaxID=2607656 RepID=A0A7L5A4N5_9BACT|nr:T9SS type A sorting domain-containing protein [Hymenobacter busanensis]KAA9338413.1 hypothetical protein F0P96_06140 [Hymenobacter busanensis]QHJ09160.1 hypothetical protein GUY19_18465 [Hymenobacter busanensis]
MSAITKLTGDGPMCLRLWVLLLAYLLSGAIPIAAQNVGDYRSLSTPLAFTNRSGWERLTAAGWTPNNTRALDFTKTFYVRHPKVINNAGVSNDVNKIVVEPGTGTDVGKLTVNARLVCAEMIVDGTSTQLIVNTELANFGETSVSNNAVATLASEGRLGKVTVKDDGEVKLADGVTTNTVLGPTLVGNGGTLSVDASGPTFEALTVQSGGQLLVNAAVTLTEALVEAGGLMVQLPNGAITVTHTTGSTLPDLLMKGTFRNQSNTHDITFALGGSMEVGAGATYTHSANGGALPKAVWSPTSTLEIKQVTDASDFANDGQTFGNVVWDTPNYGTSGSGSTTFNLNTSGLMEIAGRLTVRNTGSGRLQLTQLTGSGATTTTVGSYEQTGGQVCVARYGSSRSRVFDVTNDFVMNGGRFELSNTSSSGSGTLRVGGALSLSDATLLVSGGTTSGTIDLKGDLLLNANSDLRREITGGTALVQFSGNTVQRFRRASSATINGVVSVAVLSGATVDLADNTLTGDGDFTLNNGATLEIGHFQGIAAKTPLIGAYTGNIQVTGARTYSTSAGYVYTGSNNQVTGNGLPNNLVAGARLGVRNTGGNVTLSRATQLAGMLDLQQGNLLTTTANLLTLAPAATWQNASNNSYVAGPLARQTNSTAQVYTFPVGASGRLKVAGVKPTAATSNTYRIVAYVAPAPNNTMLEPGSGLFKVSNREYWDVTRTAGTANAIMRLYYTLPLSDISETAAALLDLRIVGLAGGQWANYGQATPPNTTFKYLDASLALPLVNGTSTNTTFGSATARNPLPVQLVEFQGRVLNGKDVQLNWRTAQEKNAAVFEVQTSVDGKEFTVLKTYSAQGTKATPTNYAHLHDNALVGGQHLRYYRLRQVDFDGQFYFSPIVTVTTVAEEAPLALEAWPVPATDWLNVQLNPTSDTGPAVLRVTDALGRTCLTQLLPASSQPQQLRLEVGQLHRGLYFVQVETKQRRVQVRFQKL